MIYELVYIMALGCSAFGECDYSPIIHKDFNTKAECELYYLKDVNNSWKNRNIIISNCTVKVVK